MGDSIRFQAFAVLLAIFGSIGVLGFRFIHAPYQHNRSVIADAIEQEKEDQRLRKDTTTLLQEVAWHRGRLAPEADPSWLVREVLVLCQNAGVRVINVGEQTRKPMKEFEHLGVKLRLKGSYHEMGRFVDLVERSKNLLRIEDFELNRPRDYKGVASVNVVIGALYLPSVEELLKSDGKKVVVKHGSHLTMEDGSQGSFRKVVENHIIIELASGEIHGVLPEDIIEVVAQPKLKRLLGASYLAGYAGYLFTILKFNISSTRKALINLNPLNRVQKETGSSP